MTWGADDYITKPFGTSELLARIRTAIRHSQKIQSGNFSDLNKVIIGELEIDYGRRFCFSWRKRNSFYAD